MITPDFISMTEERYIHPLKVAIRQALKFYPNSKYYVYACNLNKSTIDDLGSISPQVLVVEWNLHYLPVNVAYNKKFVWMKTRGMVRDLVKGWITGSFENKSMVSLFLARDFEIKIQNKLRIIKHHNDMVKKPFVFLDADAFLIKEIDELLDGTFDIGVTIKSKEKLNFTFNHCSLLNSGVLLFLGNYNANQVIIDAWYNEARHIEEHWSEQTSLARLLHKLQPDFYEDIGKTHIINLTGQDVRVRSLFVKQYNYTKIEDYGNELDKDQIKILHFKNSRFETPLFKRLAKELDIET